MSLGIIRRDGRKYRVVRHYHTAAGARKAAERSGGKWKWTKTRVYGWNKWAVVEELIEGGDDTDGPAEVSL